MSNSRSSCAECSRLRQNSMKLRMDIASLQASNRALIDKQKSIEQQIKQQKLQQQQLCLAATPGLVDSACSEELDRVKSEYFNLRQESESLRESLRTGEQQKSDAERRAVDAENWIQIKDSIIEKQRNLLKEIESKKSELQEELESAKKSSQHAEQELSRRVEELASCRLEIQRLEETANPKEKSDNCEDSAETNKGLVRQLEKARADLVKSESSLAAFKRRVALKEASVKSLQAALEEEKASAAHEENAHALLNSENAYLRSENSSLKEESERAAATIAGLETRVSELEAELNSKTESAAEMTAQIEAMTEALQENKEKLGDLEKRARGSSQGDGESGGDTLGGASELGNNEDSLPGPPQPGEEACLAAVSEKITRQETQIADLNALLAYRESCILKMHDEMEKLKSAIDVANTEKDTLNASITILKKELAQAREESKERKKVIWDIENKIEEIRQKRCREYDRRKRAEGEADELYRENDELRHRVAKLEANLKQSSESQKSRDPGVTIQITELQSQVKDLRTDNEAKRSELFDTRSKLEEKLSMIEEVHTKLKAKDRVITELRNQIYTVQSSAGSHQDELKSVRSELSRVTQQHKRVQQDMSSILASNRYLSESCNDMRTKLKEKERQISDQNEKMQSLTRAAHETPSGASSGVDSSSSSSHSKAGPSTMSGAELDADWEPGRQALEVKLKQLIEENHRQAQESAEARSKLLELELELTSARSDVAKFSSTADANLSQVQRLQAEVNRLKRDSSQHTEKMRHLLSDKDFQLTRKRKREEELVEQIEKEKRRRLENGMESSTTEVCSQCDLLGREITNVESYINQKDEEFSHLTEQLLEMKQQDSSVRSELVRSSNQLQESQLRVRKLEAELIEEKAKSRALKEYQQHTDELMRGLRQANFGYEHQMTKIKR